MSKLIKYITIGEFDSLMKSCKDKDTKLIMLFSFGAGMRISEIIGLHSMISKCCSAELIEKPVEIEKKKVKRYFCTKCEKMLSRKEMKFSKTEWQIKPISPEDIDLKAHQIRIINAKGNKDRVVPIPPGLNESHLKMLPLKIERRTLQKRIEVLGLKVLGKKLTIHQFRHGFANFMVNEKNVPLPMVQQLMGHSRLDTTGIYTKANPKASIEAAMKAWEV